MVHEHNMKHFLFLCFCFHTFDSRFKTNSLTLNKMNNKAIYTIKDIAEMAEVSRATVDRVIHGRGTVSKDTYNKIKLILDKINYQPNLIAQTLKKGELYKIAILIPDHEYDVYWKRAIDGIDMAISDYSFIGISVDKFLFNPFKEASFKLNSHQILKGGYNGVLVAPVFYNESIEFFKECESANLHYATFNTHIKESNVLCHVGQDLIQSGKTAASLFDKLVKKDEELLVLHLDEDMTNAKHMQEKEDGFNMYFKEKGFPSDKVKVLKITNTFEIEKLVIKTLEQSTKINGIFVTTSKVHYVADIIKAYDLNINLIGYDLIDENVQHLESGTIDFLIYQNPGFQASQAITHLVDHIAFKKEIPAIKFLPIEIVLKENFHNYL